MDLNIKTMLYMVLGIGLLSLIVISVYPVMGNHGTSEVITFTENDTAVDLTNAPIYLSSPYTPTLGYANGTLLDAANYTFTEYTVTITGTALDDYTARYTYYDEQWLGGSDYSWAIGLFVLLGLIGAALKILGYI